MLLLFYDLLQVEWYVVHDEEDAFGLRNHHVNQPGRVHITRHLTQSSQNGHLSIDSLRDLHGVEGILYVFYGNEIIKLHAIRFDHLAEAALALYVDKDVCVAQFPPDLRQLRNAVIITELHWLIS